MYLLDLLGINLQSSFLLNSFYNVRCPLLYVYDRVGEANLDTFVALKRKVLVSCYSCRWFVISRCCMTIRVDIDFLQTSRMRFPTSAVILKVPMIVGCRSYDDELRFSVLSLSLDHV